MHQLPPFSVNNSVISTRNSAVALIKFTLHTERWLKLCQKHKLLKEIESVNCIYLNTYQLMEWKFFLCQHQTNHITIVALRFLHRANKIHLLELYPHIFDCTRHRDLMACQIAWATVFYNVCRNFQIKNSQLFLIYCVFRFQITHLDNVSELWDLQHPKSSKIIPNFNIFLPMFNVMSF